MTSKSHLPLVSFGRWLLVVREFIVCGVSFKSNLKLHMTPKP